MSSSQNFETAPEHFVDALNSNMIDSHGDDASHVNNTDNVNAGEPLVHVEDAVSLVAANVKVEKLKAEGAPTITDPQATQVSLVVPPTEPSSVTEPVATGNAMVDIATNGHTNGTIESGPTSVDVSSPMSHEVGAPAVASADGISTEAPLRTNSNTSDNGANPVKKKLVFENIKFFINRDSGAIDSSTEADQLERLITANGGEIVKALPQQASSDFFVVSPYNDTKLPTITTTYIRTCIARDTLLPLENYLVPYDEFRAVIDSELRSLNGDGEKADQNDHIQNHVSEEQQAVEQNGLEPDQHDSSNTAHQESEQKQQQQQQQQQQQREEQLKLIHEHNIEMENINQDIAREGESHVAQNRSHAYENSRSPLVRSPNGPTHNKSSFTETEDEFILDVVRKNPTRRTTHTLYDEISHYVPNHTGNSIRHRFRVYLSKRLDFVYEVDKYGKLVRDEDGNLIKTKLLPPSIKKKFTADEDYALAVSVKKQFYRDLYQIDPDSGQSLISAQDSPTAIARRNMTMDPNHIPGSEPGFKEYKVNDRKGPIAREFFKSFADENPTHTENAWRDRYRKFLLTFGVDAYIAYYEIERASGREPKPMKNLTNRPKRVNAPTPGNYNSSVKRARAYISAKPVSNEHEQSISNADVAAAAAAAANGQATGPNYPIPENELLDEETMQFISSLKNDLSKLESTLPFEYPQEIADAIRNDFTNEEEEYDNIDPNSIKFPPPIASIELFLPTFFQMGSTREFMLKVNEVITRDYEPSQAEKLVQDLSDEAGVRRTFSTSILTALSGDLMVFPRYFLTMFKDNINPPPNVPGIWTREDDEMLRSNKGEDLQALEKKHGVGRIEIRRKFVERDLV
uniref:DNA-binding protein RAP1 n=1 Tax=Naumovozyma dairenensis TaxID=27289 RepID=Q86ZJ0_9SACH|nr:Repressor Activator Protein 1 [Naumovozyma dairenensis]